MNLLLDAWLPTTDGNKTVAEALHADQLTWPRPDLDAAATVLLIGLIQTAIAKRPELCPDENTWRELLWQPPEAKSLASWWSELTTAFELLGEGPRFMQDFGPDFEGIPVSVATLLPESPGENAVRKRSDIVRWHQEVPDAVALPVVAIMLLADGLYGTRIGRGFRQGMRGENALLTLVEPDGAGNVWSRVWLNVLSYDRWTTLFEDRTWQVGDVFPWMAATKTSRNGEVVTPTDVHPLQAYWQMPRRNRLSDVSDGICGLTGSSGPVVSTFLREQYGPNYEGWQHPLAPRYQDKDGTWSAVKMRQPHVGYDHWVGLALMTHNGVAPAALVTENVQRRMESDELLRLRCCGWHLGSAGEAGTWVDATVPLITADRRVEFESAANRLLESASLIAKYLSGSLKSIGAGRPSEFYGSTEAKFYESTRELAQDPDATEPLRDWLNHARRAAIRVFDESSDAVRRDPLRIARARANLIKTLHGPKVLATLGVEPQAA